MDTRAYPLEEVPGGHRRAFVAPAARTCAQPGCGTILSRYNPEPLCAVHTPAEAPPAFRGRKGHPGM